MHGTFLRVTPKWHTHILANFSRTGRTQERFFYNDSCFWDRIGWSSSTMSPVHSEPNPAVLPMGCTAKVKRGRHAPRALPMQLAGGIRLVMIRSQDAQPSRLPQQQEDWEYVASTRDENQRGKDLLKPFTPPIRRPAGKLRLIS